MFVCRNKDLALEVPLLLNFTSAKRHDSINFLFAIDAFCRHGTRLSPKNLCLDSAHDNIPTYKLLDHWNINSLIDVNKRNSSSDGLPGDVSLDKDAHPLCRQVCACERMNVRVLNNYHLQDLEIRGDDHFSFWTMIIGICIHLDAWYRMRSTAKQAA